MDGLLRVGTRGSALALAQAELVRALLGERLPGLEVKLEVIAVSGDRAPQAAGDGAGDGGEARGAGGEPGDKSRWVLEIEQALQDGAIDMAVHSAKDLPIQLPEGLALAGSPERGPAQDALCGAGSLEALAGGARVGTSSVRRAAQLRAARGDLEIVEIAGNVDTRLRKLEQLGEWDAIVLALAGLRRLGREDRAGAVLSGDPFVPAPGQGALALEARSDDARAGEAIAAISDPDTLACLEAERALARALEADCHAPLGAHSEPAGCGCLTMRGWVGLPDGSAWAGDQLMGDDPEGLGERMAERLCAVGAREMLDAARGMAAVGG